MEDHPRVNIQEVSLVIPEDHIQATEDQDIHQKAILGVHPQVDIQEDPLPRLEEEVKLQH